VDLSYEIKLMTEAELVEQLLVLSDVAIQQHFLQEHRLLLNEEVVRLLDLQVAHFLRADIDRTFAIASLLRYIGELTNNPGYVAWSRVNEGDAHSIGLGEYELAIACYDDAAEIYKSYGSPEYAWALVGKVNALSCISRYEEALNIGHEIGPVLEAQGWRRSLAVLTMNLGNVHSRRGEDSESLAMYDRAADLYQHLRTEKKTDWALIQNNRSIALRNLGRFDASIEVCKLVNDTLLQLGEKVEAARN